MPRRVGGRPRGTSPVRTNRRATRVAPGAILTLRETHRPEYGRRMSLTRIHSALAVLLLLATPAAAAEDCHGGRIYTLRVKADRVRLEASLTAPGLTPASFIAGAGTLRIQLIDANDPGATLYTVDIPESQFVPSGSGFRYDHTGSFTGRVLLRPSRRQQDTVRLSLRGGGSVLRPRHGARGPGGDYVGQRVHPDLRLAVPGGRRRLRAERRLRALRRRRLRRLRYRPAARDVAALRARHRHHGGLRLPRRGRAASSRTRRPTSSPPTRRRRPASASTTARSRCPRTWAAPDVDPTDWNTLDGFSPGPMIMTVLTRHGVSRRSADLERRLPHQLRALARRRSSDRAARRGDGGPRPPLRRAGRQHDQHERAGAHHPARPPPRRRARATSSRSGTSSTTSGTRSRPGSPSGHSATASSPAEIEAACGTDCAAAFAARQPVFADLFQRLADARRRPGRPPPRLGLHDREHAGADRLDGLDPRPGVRPRRRPASP